MAPEQDVYYILIHVYEPCCQEFQSQYGCDLHRIFPLSIAVLPLLWARLLLDSAFGILEFFCPSVRSRESNMPSRGIPVVKTLALLQRIGLEI